MILTVYSAECRALVDGLVAMIEAEGRLSARAQENGVATVLRARGEVTPSPPNARTVPDLVDTRTQAYVKARVDVAKEGEWGRRRRRREKTNSERRRKDVRIEWPAN